MGEEVVMEIRIGDFPMPLQAVGEVRRVGRDHGGFDIGVKFVSLGSVDVLRRLMEIYVIGEDQITS